MRRLVPLASQLINRIISAQKRAPLLKRADSAAKSNRSKPLQPIPQGRSRTLGYDIQHSASEPTVGKVNSLS